MPWYDLCFHISCRLDDLEKLVLAQQVRNQLSNSTITRVSDHSSKDSVAYNVLALLAEQLPKLITSQISQASPASSTAIASPTKRRRLDVEDKQDVPNFSTLSSPPEFPSPEKLDAIISAYFLHVHPWIPMIHQGRFRQRLKSPDENEKLFVVLHAMTIAASKFLPDAVVGAGHLVRTRTWIVSTALEDILVESLQALIILAFTDVSRKVCFQYVEDS